ncbi:MAG: SPOR domain-containing protein [Sulfuritalea sp.]|jgi:DedD protein|nr:SPOR domain-containing protein [Sulfuritalea sp.]
MAEQDTSPDELQLKKRARRRLVGAAALALFAVIVLPMVMDREPRPLNQDIQVRIPSQDSTGFASKLLPGKPATPMPAPEPKPVERMADTQAKPEAAPATSTAVPAPAKPVAQAAPPAKPAEKTPIQDKKPEAAEKPAPRANADGAGQWVIQLGAFRDAGKVNNLVSKLKGINVPAYTEKTETPQGPLVRVRAGPFASQEAAEKARGRVKIIGVDGPVAPK